MSQSAGAEGAVVLATIALQESTDGKRQQVFALLGESGEVLARSEVFKRGKGQDEIKPFLGKLRSQGWEVLREPNTRYGDAWYAFHLGRGSTPEARVSLARSAPSSVEALPPMVVVQQPKKGCLSKFGMLALGLVGLCIIVAIAGTFVSKQQGDKKNDVAVAGTSTPGLGAGENPAPVGSTITGDGLEVTVYSATLSDTAGVLGAAEPGYLYLTIDASVKNVSNEKKSVNPLYFSAKDIVNGYTFDNELMAGDPAAALGSTNDLAPGDILRGEVVLKVRDDSKQIRIKYDTSPLGGKNMYWILRVS